MASSSSLSPEQLNSILLRQPKPKTSGPDEFAYDPANDDLLESDNFRQLATALEDSGRLPSYARRLRSALTLVVRDSPYAEDLPLLKAVVLYTRSPNLRQKALCSLQLYLLDCSGDRDASLKLDVRKFLDSHDTQPITEII